MIDIRRNDRPTLGYLVPHKLRRDLLGNRSTPCLPRMLELQAVAGSLARHLHGFPHGLQFHILPNSDELHFRRNHSLAGIVQLRDRSLFSPARLTMNPRELLGHVPIPVSMPVIFRSNFTPLIKLRVLSLLDPFRPNAGQALSYVAFKIGIPPRTAGIVDADWIVGLQFPIRQTSRLEFDFTERNLQIGSRPLDIDSFHALEGVDLFDFCAAVFGAHPLLLPHPPIQPPGEINHGFPPAA